MSGTSTEKYAMIERGKMLDLVAAAFPVDPLPDRFFWIEGGVPLNDDFAEELTNKISGRPWTEITPEDWFNTGVSVSVNRSYIQPAAFMYYVPCFIVGASYDIKSLDMALDAITPFNRWHVPRGKWWFAFSESASPRQREAIRAFLAHIRLMFWDTIGIEYQDLLEIAENIWSG
jgi:hypothetical protein